MNVELRRRHGFVNAPDGTQISFTIDSGPGAFTTANPCTTAGGTGSLHDHAEPRRHRRHDGQRAHDAVGRRRLADARTPNGPGANSGPATKTWVNAKIAIAPDATNQVGAAAHVHGDADEGHR